MASIRLERDAALYPETLESEAEAEFDIVSVLTGRLEEAYQAIPEHFVTMSEFELCGESNPGPSEYKMRQNFTDAVSVARKTGRKLRVTSIYDDVITRQTFFNYYVSSPIKMAFIMRPVVPHHAYYDAIHKEGLRKMFLYVRNHDLDAKTMATFAKIIDKAGDRMIGAVTQKIDLNQKQLVKTIKANEADIDVTPENPVEMQAKIDEMQRKLQATKMKEIVATPIDVED